MPDDPDHRQRERADERADRRAAGEGDATSRSPGVVPSYAFARRPRWLLTHLLVLALAGLFVGLGFWQLDRLDERRTRNALVEAQAALPETRLDRLVTPDATTVEVEAARFRHVTAAGAYTEDAPIAVRATQDGLTGARVLSVLRLEGEDVVVVVRGFTAAGPDGEAEAPAPPSGDVEVRGSVVPLDRLDRPTRLAAERLVEGRAATLPVAIQLASSVPAEDTSVVPVPGPTLDEGPHLSYAVQWFTFATVGLVGYPFLLRRVARRR